MANFNVRKKLEKISSELNQLGEHIVSYSGVDKKDIRFVENVASDIAQTAAQIYQIAELAGGRNAPDRREMVRQALD
jgi:hypothetical protein